MRTFLKNNISTLLIVNLASGFNYLFQIAVARKLNIEDFGIFNSLNSFVVILSAPFTIISIIFSRSTAQLCIKSLSAIKTLATTGLKFMVFIGISAFFLGLMAIPLLKNYLHMDVTLPIIIVPVLIGVLQGLKRFEGFGISSSGYSITRFFTGVLWVVVLGWGINGAILAEVAGSIVTIFLGFWFLRDFRYITPEPLPGGVWKEMRSFSVPTMLSATTTLLLGNIDIIMVRHYCPDEAGLYATAAILGRICLFLPGAFNYVLFPEAVSAKATGKEGNQFLWTALGLTTLLAGGAALLFFLWPAKIIELFFGAKYADAAPLLQLISVSMALMAISNVMVTNSLAHCKFTFLWPLGGGVAMFFGLIMLFHDSSIVIAQLLLFSTSCILVGIFINHFICNLRNQTTQTQEST